ncbi:hypothetical protein [Streptomyces gilvus]|uniref:hypothetical protein n=1 Tax=Streptomyces gilvus TaxID=2920937 RepID=UPI001F0F590E|nr:hypothetical protein [Streptomyces sp. CME 23]MCH5675105.1 hypothetical protein [Streptomyces sp. CME 23]
MSNALLVLTLALVCGCAGTHAAHKSAESTTGAGDADAGVRPASMAQLLNLTLRDREVPQAREITTEQFHPKTEKNSLPPVSDVNCQKVLQIINGAGSYASVHQIFNWKGDIFPGDSLISSYEGTRATDYFRILVKAINSCNSYSGTGYAGRYRATLTVEPPPDVGDQGASFRIVIPTENGLRTEGHVVVRTGNLIAMFENLNVGGTAEFPPGLVVKQIQRLDEARKG